MALFAKKLGFTERASAPATPAAGNREVYYKTDGLLYSKDSAGVETVIGVIGEGTAISGTSGALTVVMDGNVKNLSPTDDCTLIADVTGVPGQMCTFIIFANGAYTITFGDNFWSSGTLSTSSSTMYIVTFLAFAVGYNWAEINRVSLLD